MEALMRIFLAIILICLGQLVEGQESERLYQSNGSCRPMTATERKAADEEYRKAAADFLQEHISRTCPGLAEKKSKVIVSYLAAVRDGVKFTSEHIGFLKECNKKKEAPRAEKPQPAA